MKIIEAGWEKRNLGVSCIELLIDSTDSLNDIPATLESLDAEYIVAKAPVAYFEASQILNQHGFQFIEASIRLSHNLALPPLDTNQTEILSKISIRPASDHDRQTINANITNGMFYSDRVYLDPYFKNASASIRYINWIEDEIKKGCLLYMVCYNQSPIGFSAVSPGAESYNQFLMGLFPDFHGRGYGFSIIYAPVRELKQLGVSHLTTTVSANNFPSLKTHLKSGFSIANIEYVFIKHA